MVLPLFRKISRFLHTKFNYDPSFYSVPKGFMVLHLTFYTHGFGAIKINFVLYNCLRELKK